MNRRAERFSELLRKELSVLLATEVHDPRLPALVSITRVGVTDDLRHANVYVSIMGTGEEKQSGMKVLKDAAGFLHRALKPRLDIRYVPELSFQLDESIEAGDRTLRIMDGLDSSAEPSQ
ncbi:MAG: 30S ribosome-binding factor RbfA [Chloroflexota bacterium]